MGDPADLVRKNKTSSIVIAHSKLDISRSISNIARTQSRLSRIKDRKQSYGFSGVPGVRPIERTSQTGMEYKRPAMLYLPTYQLEPTIKFNLAYVTKVVDDVLDEHWTDHKYSQIDSPHLAMRMANDLMRRLKNMQFNRYRIISIVTIGQKRAQSYNNAIGFLWDFERDGYVEAHREVHTAFIQVTVFGIYLD